MGVHVDKPGHHPGLREIDYSTAIDKSIDDGRDLTVLYNDRLFIERGLARIGDEMPGMNDDLGRRRGRTGVGEQQTDCKQTPADRAKLHDGYAGRYLFAPRSLPI